MGEALHEWIIKEYVQYERGVRWYVLMGAAAVALVLYGMLTSNFLFSLIIILAAIILFLQSHQKPAEIPFQITELGVALNNKFYSYSEIDSFYIVYQPPEIKTLFLQQKSLFHPVLRISLEEANPVEVRNTLREFLSEDTEREEEPLSDTVARKWKIQ